MVICDGFVDTHGWDGGMKDVCFVSWLVVAYFTVTNNDVGRSCERRSGELWTRSHESEAVNEEMYE